MGGRNNYGQVNDVRCPMVFPAATTSALKAAGGKFMTIDTNGAVTLSVVTSLAIIGWAQVGEFTFVAGDMITVNIAADAVYEMPTDAAATEAALKALLGQTCDIATNSGIQQADIGASTYDTLQIVGYHYYYSGTGGQTVLVRLNRSVTDAACGALGVA